MDVQLPITKVWENGVTEIKVSDLLHLSALYGIPIEFLEVPEKRK